MECDCGEEEERREVFDELEGEMSMRRNRENGRRRKRRRSGGVYVLGIGAGNKCCTQRRRGQVEFSGS